MMCNDMSLAELKQYEGSSPKPADFDSFWARALQELEAQPLDYELVPADFASPLADCYHLHFTGVGGARIHAKYVKPLFPISGYGSCYWGFFFVHFTHRIPQTKANLLRTPII